MKSLSFKHVLAIGLLIAGVAQQEAHGMAATRRIGTAMAKLGRSVLNVVKRNPKKAIAVAGLTTAYGCHKAAGPIKQFSFEARWAFLSNDGKYIFGGRVVAIDYGKYNTTIPVIICTQTGKEIDSSNINLSEKHTISTSSLAGVTFPVIPMTTPCPPEGIIKDLTTKIFNIKNKNLVLKTHARLSYPPVDITNHIWTVEENPNFFGRLKHWSGLAATFIKAKWTSFWQQPKQVRTK